MHSPTPKREKKANPWGGTRRARQPEGKEGAQRHKKRRQHKGNRARPQERVAEPRKPEPDHRNKPHQGQQGRSPSSSQRQEQRQPGTTAEAGRRAPETRARSQKQTAPRATRAKPELEPAKRGNRPAAKKRAKRHRSTNAPEGATQAGEAPEGAERPTRKPRSGRQLRRLRPRLSSEKQGGQAPLG